MSTSTDAERALFEVFAKRRFGTGMVLQANNGPYVWDEVDNAWAVWQARAALPVPAAPVVP